MTISYDFLSTTVEGNPQSTPPGTFTKSSPAGRRDTNGTAAVSSDFNGEGCDEIAKNGDLPTKIISNLFRICQKKPYAALIFQVFFW